jgi:hypothetical protein
MHTKLKPFCVEKFVIHRRDPQSVGIFAFGSLVIWLHVYEETFSVGKYSWFSRAFVCIF